MKNKTKMGKTKNTNMKTIYFNFIAQKTADGKTVLMAVVPDDLLGKDLPTIFEVQAFKMPATIYTGTYPQIKINTDTIKPRPDLIGMGAGGIITEVEWYNKVETDRDLMGISIERTKATNAH